MVVAAAPATGMGMVFGGRFLYDWAAFFYISGPL